MIMAFMQYEGNTNPGYLLLLSETIDTVQNINLTHLMGVILIWMRYYNMILMKYHNREVSEKNTHHIMQAVKVQISLHKQTDQNLGCLKWLFFKQSLDIAVYIKEQEANLFVLRFYGPFNPMGSCRARSVYLTTRLLGRLSPLSG